MATNFLQFCTSGANGLALALAAGASGIDYVVGVGRIYTGSVEGVVGNGLLVASAVALEFNFVGSGLRIGFWGSSTTSFPLPSSVSNGEIASFCCLQCSSIVVSIRHSSSGFSSFW